MQENESDTLDPTAHLPEVGAVGYGRHWVEDEGNPVTGMMPDHRVELRETIGTSIEDVAHAASRLTGELASTVAGTMFEVKPFESPEEQQAFREARDANGVRRLGSDAAYTCAYEARLAATYDAHEAAKAVVFDFGPDAGGRQRLNKKTGAWETEARPQTQTGALPGGVFRVRIG